MEAIGDTNGLSADTIGTILTLSIAAGFAGASLAAWLGNRYGHIWPLNAGLVFAVIAVLLLAYGDGLAIYVFAACVINGMLQYTIAYQMGLVAHNDYSWSHRSDDSVHPGIECRRRAADRGHDCRGTGLYPRLLGVRCSDRRNISTVGLGRPAKTVQPSGNFIKRRGQL